MFSDIVLGNFKVDSYCKEAEHYTGSSGLCTDCPFRDCIYSLNYGDKQLILQSDIIKQVYQDYDRSNNIKQTAQQTGLDYHTVRRWLANRSSIESKLELYAPV